MTRRPFADVDADADGDLARRLQVLEDKAMGGPYAWEFRGGPSPGDRGHRPERPGAVVGADGCAGRGRAPAGTPLWVLSYAAGAVVTFR